jgi:hypothetical protein
LPVPYQKLAPRQGVANIRMPGGAGPAGRKPSPAMGACARPVVLNLNITAVAPSRPMRRRGVLKPTNYQISPIIKCHQLSNLTDYHK